MKQFTAWKPPAPTTGLGTMRTLIYCRRGTPCPFASVFRYRDTDVAVSKYHGQLTNRSRIAAPPMKPRNLSQGSAEAVAAALLLGGLLEPLADSMRRLTWEASAADRGCQHLVGTPSRQSSGKTHEARLEVTEATAG